LPPHHRSPPPFPTRRSSDLRSRCPLAPSRGPLTFNLYPSFAACRVLPKTAPFPVLRTRAQPSPHRIAMNVAQLLHELPVISNVRSEEHTSELQSRGHLVCRL